MKNTTKEILLGKTAEEIKTLLSKFDLPQYRANQIAKWIYSKRVNSLEQMTDLSLSDRKILDEHFCIGCNPATDEKISVDGTRKYLFDVSDSNEKSAYVESVYIPDRERSTLCVSSQSGCRMGCTFCATGAQGFNASLSCDQILNQFYSIPFSEEISHFVFMGMGEPFDNTDEVLKALSILTSTKAFAFSPRRITVSSVGVIPGLRRFLNESECHLAISLHSPFADEREMWVPAQKKYPIEEIVDLLRQYDFQHQRKLSFEYILFGGLNDTVLHAKALVRLLRGLDWCKVNLILYHPVPGKTFKRPAPEQAFLFRDYLSDNGLFATLRQSRGEDIEAACGLLSHQKRA